MSNYELTTEAQKSIEQIEAYSLEHFGKRQTGLYLAALRECMASLAKKPRLGKQRPELFNDWHCYSFPQGSHVIFYEIVNPAQINVIDVLHKSMLPKNYLSQ